MTKVALTPFELRKVRLSGGELGQGVLGWVELKLYQKGLSWVVMVGSG